MATKLKHIKRMRIRKHLLSISKLCSYCGCDCSTNFQIDHIEPLSTTGIHTLDNITIVCSFCNNSKHNNIMLVWFAKRINRS